MEASARSKSWNTGKPMAMRSAGKDGEGSLWVYLAPPPWNLTAISKLSAAPRCLVGMLRKESSERLPYMNLSLRNEIPACLTGRQACRSSRRRCRPLLGTFVEIAVGHDNQG